MTAPNHTSAAGLGMPRPHTGIYLWLSFLISLDAELITAVCLPHKMHSIWATECFYLLMMDDLGQITASLCHLTNFHCKNTNLNTLFSVFSQILSVLRRNVWKGQNNLSCFQHPWVLFFFIYYYFWRSIPWSIVLIVLLKRTSIKPLKQVKLK